MAAATTPTNTYMTFLMYSTDSGSTYTELCPIKDYPDFLNSINTIDVTDLEHAMHQYIQGLIDNGGDMVFTANYIASDYQTLKALAGQQYLAIYFGGTAGATPTPTGADGMWKFNGFVSVGIVGKGADEAREMQIHVTPNSDFDFSIPA